MRENRFKVQTSVDRGMTTVFWESEGNLLVEFLKKDATVNTE
jgi:hypothetical protein